MAERAKLVIPKRFKDKYGEKIPLWSYSKINTYNNCKHEYYLSRIKKVQSLDNIYTLCGSYAHDILEQFYKNKIKKEDMPEKFETDFLDVEVSDFKFSSDSDRNTKMRKKYKDCVLHFFKHHEKMANKVAIEKLIWIDVDGNLFLGYVDAVHKDSEGNFIITDFKTSSMYKGKDVKEHGKQLLLYALGLIQGGVDINKIKVRWLFLKYVNITYRLKNGKLKTTIGDRNKWVEKIKTPLKRDLKETTNMEEWQIDLKIEECIRNNSIDDLDEDIKNKYLLEECYVYPNVNKEEIEQLKQELIHDINEINKKGKEESNWGRNDIEPSQEYYCNVLCGVKRECKYYTSYLEKLGKEKKDEDDIFKALDEILPF